MMSIKLVGCRIFRLLSSNITIEDLVLKILLVISFFKHVGKIEVGFFSSSEEKTPVPPAIAGGWEVKLPDPVWVTWKF